MGGRFRSSGQTHSERDINLVKSFPQIQEIFKIFFYWYKICFQIRVKNKKNEYSTQFGGFYWTYRLLFLRRFLLVGGNAKSRRGGGTLKLDGGTLTLVGGTNPLYNLSTEYN